ncbi:ABC transporter permease [Actinomadura darangshiensis]|uniref:ABC transporter permease n=1 Tax=Actinomadura darangshiensis TaxID=705336 RepID=A0A4R5BK52_9ACTN|nr:ABC transporter permease [Actinomadura darangshiensis]TDD84172.1 ABC transporter permease [Actinomadura darangshiensis]
MSVEPDITVPAAPAAAGSPPTGTAVRVGFLRRFRRQRAAVAALAILVLITLAAVLAPWWTLYDPAGGSLSDALSGPSGGHWLGTDDLGRDVFTRMMYGARLSLGAAVIAVGVAMAIGLPLGLIAGYAGGLVDSAIMRVNDALMSFPPLILAISIVGFLGAGLTNAMIAIGVIYAPRFMRVVRGAAMAVREETYVEAARMMGAPAHRIVRRHVLPNILSPLLVEISLSLGFAIIAEASLSFIGLGVQPPSASLGSMLGEAFRHLRDAPVYAIGPGVAIMIIVLSLNVLGDGLRDSLGRRAMR